MLLDIPRIGNDLSGFQGHGDKGDHLQNRWEALFKAFFSSIPKNHFRETGTRGVPEIALGPLRFMPTSLLNVTLRYNWPFCVNDCMTSGPVPACRSERFFNQHVK